MNAPTWHARAWCCLQARRQHETLPHAILLAGPSGLGKRHFLQRFVHGLLCEKPNAGDGCGHCRHCLLLKAGSHPDYITLNCSLRKDGTQRSEIVVEEIRALSARLTTSSQFGGWQIASIDPADTMNVAAANALLKTLEEPARQTMLVLIADVPWRLPATIRSRCQRIDFKLPPREQALAWLEAEGVTDAAQALHAAGNNPGRARDWVRSGALAWRNEVRRDLKALAAGGAAPLEVTQRWLDIEPEQRLWFAAQAVADEVSARVCGNALPLSSTMDSEALWHWYDHANRAREALRGPLRSDLLLFELLSAWC